MSRVNHGSRQNTATNPEALSQLKAIQSALQAEGGVYKRLDEIREFTELLQRDAPEFLAAHPWVLGWLQSSDNFLAELARAADPDHSRPFLFSYISANFNDFQPSMPRPRPDYRPV